VGTCTDVTERHRHEQELRMTEKLAMTGRMTSVIAHEINNPLEAITNLLYLLRHEVKEDEGPARSYIGMAESELHRISGITKQTLRWSRDAVHVAETFPAAVLFEDVQQLFGGKIRNRSVTVSVLGGADVMVHGVLGQLRQVLANLVSNAIDAAPVGGALSLEAVSSDDAVDLVVGDNGVGMSEEVQKKIFQAYYSTKGDLGNGLGLYITQEIIEKHGGKVMVESELGRGTRIRVRLPYAARR
jgi:signal transduction histidine kinase